MKMQRQRRPPLVKVLLLSTAIICSSGASVGSSAGQKEKEQRRVQEEPALFPDGYYSHDGKGNNIRNSLLGAAGQPRIRSHPALNGYVDGLSEPRGVESGLPSAWRVMTELFRTAPPHKDKAVSQLLLFFGQFIAHDVTRSSPSGESMPIPCDHKLPTTDGDAGTKSTGSFCPMGALETPFQRAQWATSTSNPSSEGKTLRASVNFGSSFIDLDHLYGTDENDMSLRTGVGGRMALDEHGTPPRNSVGHFALGDDPGSRSSPGIFVVAVAFLRYHNLVADALRESDPTLTDDELYRAARRKTIAVYQNIAEEAYVPTVVGEALDPYWGYDDSVDPSIDVFFSTCSFRYGHSGISGLVRLLDPDLKAMGRDPVLLRDAFLNVEGVVDDIIADGTAGDVVAPIVRGLASNPAKAVDASFVDDFNVFTDAIPVRNIQRGRDNGLPPYNDAREWFGLGRARTMEDLSRGDPAVERALRGLYGDSVDNVDAYVGGLLEAPADGQVMGPLMTASIKDQFTRLRDGDRLWYKNLYSPEQISEFPTMSEMLKMVFGEDEMRFFPTDSFSALTVATDDGQCETELTLELIGGNYELSWEFHMQKTRMIDVTITVDEMIYGGFFGIGWGSQTMNGAEMWFCVNSRNPRYQEKSPSCPKASSDYATDENAAVAEPLFSCCVAPGKTHVKPVCAKEDDDIYYPLEVIDSCLSEDVSTATIRAPVCGPNDGDDARCLRIDETGVDFVAAYSPSSNTAAHGFSRRTFGHVDLTGGTLKAAAAASGAPSNTAFFALHGAAMMLCWLVLAPAAVYIVRYMKGKSWRLVAHIGLVWSCGSLAGSLIFAAVLSVENTPPSEHKIFGLTLCLLYGLQLLTGELRYTREISMLVKSRLLDRAVFISHRFGGVIIIFLGWWNCYTGLVRIGPEDSYVGVTLFNSFALGYDMQDFGLIRRYIFVPYLIVVCVIFLVTEARMRYKGGSKHMKRIEEVSKGVASIWGDDPDKDELDTMTIETFLDLTRNGSEFCIVDGRVLDISNFISVHPGGMRVLRFAVGSDITEYMLGQESVDGFRHVHSPVALRTLKSLCKAKLDVPKNRVPGNNTAINSPAQHNVGNHFFHKALIVEFTYITAKKDIKCKPVVRMCLSLPRATTREGPATIVPGSNFIFRGRDAFGGLVERHYTPVRCFNRGEEESENFADSGGALPSHRLPCSNQSSKRKEDVYEFFISLIPGGRMSSFLMQKKPGSHIMVQGVNVNSTILEKFHAQMWTHVFFVAAGTGIAPMLPLIDYILEIFDRIDTSGWGPSKSRYGIDGSVTAGKRKDDRPTLFLAWIVKDLSLHFDEAAGIREREERSKGLLKCVVIYDSTRDVLKHQTSQQDVVQGMLVDQRKKSLRTNMNLAKKLSSFRGLRQVNGDASQERTSTSGLPESRLKSKKCDYPSELSGTTGGRHLTWGAGDDGPEDSEELASKYDSVIEIHENFFRSEKSMAQWSVPTDPSSDTISNRDVLCRARSLGKGALVSKETAATASSKQCRFDDDVNAQLWNGKCVKRRLDKTLMAELLGSATGIDFLQSSVAHTSIYKSATDTQITALDDSEVKHDGTLPNILVAISGLPTFEDQVIKDLKRLRIGTEQIITFQG